MKKLFIMVTASILTACGGGSTTSSSTSPTTPGTPQNIALSSQGATISSSFAGNESFTIDGDTTNSNFWAAGSNGDSLTIDFKQSYILSNITIRNTQMNSNTEFKVELSSDNINYTEVQLFSGSQPRCTSLTLGSVFSCDLNFAAQYLRLTILMDANNIEIYEIEAMGL